MKFVVPFMGSGFNVLDREKRKTSPPALSSDSLALTKNSTHLLTDRDPIDCITSRAGSAR